LIINDKWHKIHAVMPKYRTISWDDFKISLKPSKGLRRFIVFRWIPYFSGTNINLLLSVKTRSKKKLDFISELRCYRFDGKNNNFIDIMSGSWIPDIQPTAKYKENISEYLVTYGEYIMDVRITNSLKTSEYFTITNFSILERDKYIPSIVFSFLSLVIGAGLTLLVQFMVG
jgi:hypothetical protein